MNTDKIVAEAGRSMRGYFEDLVWGHLPFYDSPEEIIQAAIEKATKELQDDLVKASNALVEITAARESAIEKAIAEYDPNGYLRDRARAASLLEPFEPI